MKEVWKDIPEYEGCYQASTMGRIRSVDRKVVFKDGRTKILDGQILKPTNYKDRDLRTNLNKNGNKKQYTVHRLIMLTFKGERPEGMDICHTNGDFKDNRLKNLRYDTSSQNSIDMYRYGSKSGGGKLFVGQVLEIRRLHATGNYKRKDLAKMFDVHEVTIGKIINRKTFSWLNDDGTIGDTKTTV